MTYEELMNFIFSSVNFLIVVVSLDMPTFDFYPIKLKNKQAAKSFLRKPWLFRMLLKLTKYQCE
ncbi:hypothetical protein [Priestia megaterium]|uniref:hypothetical protein n=1 Tax=Priestia megaterium TaxID=1404 RepID=UPI003241DE4E